MHLLVVAETYPENFDKFEGWLRWLQLENGKKWNCQPREIRLYDLVIPKEAEKEVIQYLKPMNNQNHLDVIDKIKKYLKFLFKGILPIDNNVEPIMTDKLQWWAYATPIAKVEDNLDEKGREKI